MRPTGVIPSRLARPVALSGLLLFAGSLIYFVYRYAVAFAERSEGATRTAATAIDVLLFSVFALHHSVFARDAVRQWIGRRVGALERSVYVWIASALFIIVCAAWRPVAGVAWQVTQPALAWGIGLGQVAGVLLSLVSASLIDIRDLAGLRQLDEAADAVPQPPTFKTRGPYGWVRHPIYSGWLLIVFAVPVMTMTRLVFAATSSLYLLIAIPFEERSLRRSSHGAYDRYTRLVPWRLVPWVF